MAHERENQSPRLSVITPLRLYVGKEFPGWGRGVISGFARIHQDPQRAIHDPRAASLERDERVLFDIACARAPAGHG
jgi:hypothetical protein